MSGKEDGSSKEGDGRGNVKVVERPTFILKTREGENRALSPSQRNGNKKETDSHITVLPAKQPENKTSTPACLEMTNSISLMDENMQICENVQHYLLDQQDFLVVGILGPQGSGKSTILNKLVSNNGVKVFQTQSTCHEEDATCCTTGIDLFVTKNRVLYLDTQPILSTSELEKNATFDVRKTTNDFGSSGSEMNLELQSLQFAAFLFSVCHVVIFVQDWFTDPNLVRFIQTAEMLKPSSTVNMDQDYVEHYPHLLFLHNKADMQDFLPSNMEIMKNFYKKAFFTSKLQTRSGLSMNKNMKRDDYNLFLIPDFSQEDASTFHEKETVLLDRLRMKIHGVCRNALTPSIMTEKNWFHYISKVNEAIKKSHLSSEYSRLMP